METKKTCKDCRKYIPSGMDVTAPPYCWEKLDICDSFIPKIGTENVLREINSLSAKYYLVIKSPVKQYKWIVVLTPKRKPSKWLKTEIEGWGDDLPEAVMNAIKAMERKMQHD